MINKPKAKRLNLDLITPKWLVLNTLGPFRRE